MCQSVDPLFKSVPEACEKDKRFYAYLALIDAIRIGNQREWETAHKLTERLCRRQQRLETRLVESVGFPCATVRLPEGEDVTIHSIEALNEVLGKGPDMAALRKKAEADFALGTLGCGRRGGRLSAR
ncbi:hypothetical protein FJ970_10415 [Mesorhizobium sp. B2-1-8]|uniref:hypothetical protein n=1 Tax=Mesorhizobium sp. B2-1-8 TaxID=2589967 RepID=UPI00112D9FF3|nr:hypothetical protein [Mesorhizobium sp. B2-1-8]UCI21336.1 hypothetical protein FJ970_10415 [Mesorhizobium sp. B2-1-8]